MGQSTVVVSNPLAANSWYASGLQRQELEFPYLTITIAADQPGTLYVSEQGDGGAAQTPTATIPIQPIGTPGVLGVARVFTVKIRQPYFSLRYVNGATTQQAFSLQWNTDLAAYDPVEGRYLALILEELRTMSLLIASLKEPVMCQVNAPYGTDPQLPN